MKKAGIWVAYPNKNEWSASSEIRERQIKTTVFHLMGKNGKSRNSHGYFL